MTDKSNTQAAEVAVIPRVWRNTLRKLAFMAGTSGGTAGPDQGLKDALKEAMDLLDGPYRYADAAQPTPEPVAQAVDLFEARRQALTQCTCPSCKPVALQGRDETAWLIEWPMPDGAAPVYWTGGEVETKGRERRLADFDRDSLKAVRFARKEDAEKVLDYLCAIRLVRVDLFEEMDRKKLDERPGNGYIDTLIKNGFINVKKDYRVVGARELYRVTEHMWSEADRASLPAGESTDAQATPIPCALNVAGVTYPAGTPFCDVIDKVMTELESARRKLASMPAGGVVGYMNAGHVHELRMRRANYGYVYPKAEVGASVPVYATPQPSETPAPIPMVLHCPKCGMQHIDAPEPGRDIWTNSAENPIVEIGGWKNPDHRSHLCHGCGTIWRPADVPTTGVKATATKGKADNWVPSETQGRRQMTDEQRREVLVLAGDDADGQEDPDVWGLAIISRTEAFHGIPASPQDGGGQA